jgi:hypothetical protein
MENICERKDLVYVDGCPINPYVKPKFQHGDYIFVVQESTTAKKSMKYGYILFASWSLNNECYVYGIDPLSPLDSFSQYTPESEIYSMKNADPRLTRFRRMLYLFKRAMKNPKNPISEMKNKIKEKQENPTVQNDFSIESLPETKKLKIKKEVKRLVEKHPNDLELGKAVRALVIKYNEGKEKPKKVKLPKVDKSKICNSKTNKPQAI